MRHFLHSIKLANLVECVDAGRKSSVEAEDLALDHGSQRQVIEEFCELLPHIRVTVFSQALVIETITIQNRGVNAHIR